MILRNEKGDLDTSLDLLDALTNEGIITNKEEQLIGVDDESIHLRDIEMSDELGRIVKSFSGFLIFNEPDETDPTKVTPGVSTADKIGTVPVFENTYADAVDAKVENLPEDDDDDLTRSIENYNSNSNNKLNEKMSKLKTFADVELDENLESDVEDKATDVVEDSTEIGAIDPEETEETDEEVRAFSEEEIEEARKLEEEEKQLEKAFSAKSNVRNFSRKAKRKTFSEDLTDEEKEQIVEDILTLVNEVPSIKEEILGEISEGNPVPTVEEAEEAIEEAEAKTEEVEEEEIKEFSEEEIAEVVDLEDEEIDEVKEFTEEEISALEDETEEEIEEDDIREFSEDEIAEVGESTEESEKTDETVEADDEDEEETEDDKGERKMFSRPISRSGVQRIFSKTIHGDSALNYRQQELARMAGKK